MGMHSRMCMVALVACEVAVDLGDNRVGVDLGDPFGIEIPGHTDEELRAYDGVRGECEGTVCWENPRPRGWDPGAARTYEGNACLRDAKSGLFFWLEAGGYSFTDESIARENITALQDAKDPVNTPACLPTGEVYLYGGTQFPNFKERDARGAWRRLPLIGIRSWADRLQSKFPYIPTPRASWARGPNDAWIVGNFGVFQRRADGWHLLDTPFSTKKLDLVWGLPSGEIFVREVSTTERSRVQDIVGVHKFDGTTWTPVDMASLVPPGEPPGELVWGVAEYGLTFVSVSEGRYAIWKDGAWKALPPVGPYGPFDDRLRVKAYGNSLLFESSGSLAFWDGAAWRRPMVSSGEKSLRAVAYDRSRERGVAVGDCGTILERVGDMPWRPRTGKPPHPPYGACLRGESLQTAWVGEGHTLAAGDLGVVVAVDAQGVARVEATLPTPVVHSLHGRDGLILAGGDRGVLYARDARGSWHPYPAELPTRASITSVLVAQHETVWVATAEDWADFYEGLYNTRGGLYRSEKGGAFVRMGEVSPYVEALVADGDNVYAVSHDGLFRVQGDALVPVPLPAEASQLRRVSIANGRIDALLTGSGVLLHTRANTWVPAAPNVDAFDLAPTGDGRTIFVGGVGSIILSRP